MQTIISGIKLYYLLVLFTSSVLWASGPLAHWTLNETSGTSASDSSGNGLNGTLEGGLNFSSDSVSGKLGNALSFNGTSDYVDMGDIPDWDLHDEDHSLSLWIKAAATQSSYAKILSRRDSPNAGFYISINNNHGRIKYKAISDLSESGSDLELSSPNSYKDDTWHHIVIVVDAERETGYLYIDGSLIDTDEYRNNLESCSEKLTLGSDNDGTSDFYSGLIDDVRIYKRMIEQEEIKDIYMLAAGRWKMEAGSGSYVLDGSGNNFTGTTGASWVNDGEDTVLDFEGNDDIDMGNGVYL